MSDSIANLQSQLRAFAQARDWERYHTPKNLAMAIASEAGELAAVLRWTAEGDDLEQHRPELEDEMADILIFLVRLADVFGTDLLAAARAKVERNEGRFPAG